VGAIALAAQISAKVFFDLSSDQSPKIAIRPPLDQSDKREQARDL
jgi:hypothetical protein